MEIEKLIEIFSGWEDELKKGFLKLKNEFVPDFIPIVGYPAEKMVRGCVDAEWNMCLALRKMNTACGCR